jgi:hypothetical protein
MWARRRWQHRGQGVPIIRERYERGVRNAVGPSLDGDVPFLSWTMATSGRTCERWRMPCAPSIDPLLAQPVEIAPGFAAPARGVRRRIGRWARSISGRAMPRDSCRLSHVHEHVVPFLHVTQSEHGRWTPLVVILSVDGNSSADNLRERKNSVRTVGEPLDHSAPSQCE